MDVLKLNLSSKIVSLWDFDRSQMKVEIAMLEHILTKLYKLTTLPLKFLIHQWGPSRACVQAGPALYHVINMDTRT